MVAQVQAMTQALKFCPWPVVVAPGGMCLGGGMRDLFAWLVLTDCKVPVENLLGQAGKGHQIAFNILNVGRYKLAANAVGGSRIAFRNGVRYARERLGFGRPITSFGLVKEKIADSAAGIFTLEATLFRVVGAINAALAELDKASPAHTQDMQKRIEEFAVECSILKVFGSEMLDRVVDQMLQLHGGYGYVEAFLRSAVTGTRG